jgi:hypothetical protein
MHPSESLLGAFRLAVDGPTDVLDLARMAKLRARLLRSARAGRTPEQANVTRHDGGSAGRAARSGARVSLQAGDALLRTWGASVDFPGGAARRSAVRAQQALRGRQRAVNHPPVRRRSTFCTRTCLCPR